eukprot:14015505-Alexandrium_andersonii.AAC.1
MAGVYSLVRLQSLLSDLRTLELPVPCDSRRRGETAAAVASHIAGSLCLVVRCVALVFHVRSVR